MERSDEARRAVRAGPASEYHVGVQKAIWLLVWLFVRFIRTDVRGWVPDAPCIVVSNHLHYLDILLAGHFVTHLGERVHWLAKSELFGVPLVGTVLRAMCTVEIHRGTADRRAMEQIIRYARSEKVWIFPEGHRSESGRLQPGKEGTVLVARKAGTPLVPVGIAGTEGGVLPLLLRRKTFRLRIGEPFLLPAGQSRHAAMATVMERIAALLPEEYRASPVLAATAPPNPPRRQRLA